MINLKLFTALQGDNTASLLLQPSTPGKVTYYLMSSNVNYDIVATGICDGELPNDNPKVFDVTLSSISPLIDRNHEFKFVYKQGVLKLVELYNKFAIEPQCIEKISDVTNRVLAKYIEFNKAYVELKSMQSRFDELQTELKYIRANLENLSNPDSGWVNSSNPFPVDDKEEEKNTLRLRLEEREQEYKRVSTILEKIREVDMTPLRRISNSAARLDAIIEMHGPYAVHSLPSGYAFEKCECTPRAVPGKLLQRLVRDKNGKFYETGSDLVFVSTVSKEKTDERCTTYVFFEPSMPRFSVDATLITKGTVTEQYTLNIKGMMDVVTPILPKFENMVWDMGASKLILSNDRGESFSYKFELEDVKSLELNKLLRGETTGTVTMATVEVPRDIQRIISDMREDFTIYIKANKIVLKSGTYYVVFGR